MTTTRIALGVLLLVLPLAAQDAEEKRLAKKFETALKRLEKSAKKGDYRKLDTTLEKLLPAHAYAPYAIQARPRLEKLLVERAVLSNPKRADLRRAVKEGVIETADEKTGEIEISWTRETMAGLNPSKDKSGRFFPFTLRGDHEVILTGKKYPESGAPVYLAVCSSEKRSIAIFYGTKPKGETQGTRCVIVKNLGERQGTLDEKKSPAFKGGRKWTAKVKVSENKIVAYAGSKKIFSVDRPEEWWGSAGFSDRGDWTKVTVKGMTDLDAYPWKDLRELRTKQDERVRKTFKPQEHLPAWLYAD
jgi:hypothetical protein